MCDTAGSMGKRGPPPKPSALKHLEGTYRPDRAAPNEVIAPPGAPEKPDGMPAEASARWDALVDVLLQRRTLAEEDAGILEAHCRAYGMWRQYLTEAETLPMVKTATGTMRINPASAEARLWEARTTTTGDRLGLSASARSRVSATGETPDAEDAADEFLFGKPQVLQGGKA